MSNIPFSSLTPNVIYIISVISPETVKITGKHPSPTEESIKAAKKWYRSLSLLDLSAVFSVRNLEGENIYEILEKEDRYQVSLKEKQQSNRYNLYYAMIENEFSGKYDFSSYPLNDFIRTFERKNIVLRYPDVYFIILKSSGKKRFEIYDSVKRNNPINLSFDSIKYPESEEGLLKSDLETKIKEINDLTDFKNKHLIDVSQLTSDNEKLIAELNVTREKSEKLQIDHDAIQSQLREMQDKYEKTLKEYNEQKTNEPKITSISPSDVSTKSELSSSSLGIPEAVIFVPEKNKPIEQISPPSFGRTQTVISPVTVSSKSVLSQKSEKQTGSILPTAMIPISSDLIFEKAKNIALSGHLRQYPISNMFSGIKSIKVTQNIDSFDLSPEKVAYMIKNHQIGLLNLENKRYEIVTPIEILISNVLSLNYCHRLFSSLGLRGYTENFILSKLGVISEPVALQIIEFCTWLWYYDSVIYMGYTSADIRTILSFDEDELRTLLSIPSDIITSSIHYFRYCLLYHSKPFNNDRRLIGKSIISPKDQLNHAYAYGWLNYEKLDINEGSGVYNYSKINDEIKLLNTAVLIKKYKMKIPSEFDHRQIQKYVYSSLPYLSGEVDLVEDFNIDNLLGYSDEYLIKNKGIKQWSSRYDILQQITDKLNLQRPVSKY